MSYVGGGLFFLWTPDAATVTATATQPAGVAAYVGHGGLGIGMVGGTRRTVWLGRLGGGSTRKRKWKAR